MTIREKTEAIEKRTLSPFAVCCADSRGRDVPIAPCPMRTDFQRDRDRILHCKSFRRLMHKTQMILAPEGDHYCTRLTHTLEVSQIARTISRGLRLNEDLAEAIALAHDLGHSPFGHAGEEALDSSCGLGFNHTLQSVRVVERLEKNGRGLNLTKETRDGIACHSSGKEAFTLEGRIVRYADKIAYLNHDIEDSIRAGALLPDEIPWNIRHKLGQTKTERITAFVVNMTENSSDKIAFDAQHLALYNELKDFMFENVYTNTGKTGVKGEEGKAKDVVRRLYAYFADNPDKLPGEYKRIREEEGAERAVLDYISGMTDRYCIAVYESVFIPQSWGVNI
ncbi:MAG: deoxyguanosinetriphosphate triphosphohydrolase [Oscillospiraceae bacterium]|nr:deoxyguanosinetriphosphate triphosphohydrolase [Oscillospiraceae bacterium]